jgi:hypothetical protein
MGVYVCTAIASVLVYIWLIVILQILTPDLVTPMEGAVTFLAFPVLVLMAYLLDIGFFSRVSSKWEVGSGKWEVVSGR